MFLPTSQSSILKFISNSSGTRKGALADQIRQLRPRDIPRDIGLLDLSCTQWTSPDDRQPSDEGTSFKGTWMICNALGWGAGLDAIHKTATSESSFKLIPWVGVAAQMPMDGGVASSSDVQGKAFCFLPMPVSTGLPVHINGLFELSTNRRELWYVSVDNRDNKHVIA